MTPPKIKVRDGRIGIVNAFARTPFRFGVVTLEAAASATLALDVTVDGVTATGYASDLLAYKWFDKRPEKTPADNVADLLWAIDEALAVARDLPAATLFDLWRDIDRTVDRRGPEVGFNRLGASFGVSMVERAMIDALGRAAGRPFFDLVTGNALGLRPGDVFPELAAMQVAQALPDRPLSRLALRHTVGLVDPLDGDEAGAGTGDVLPGTLADYIAEDGLRYLKIKVGGDMAADLDRLARIAALIEAAPHPIAVTLDGNEQYRSLDAFAALCEAMRTRPDIAPLHEAILFVEQPLERSVALAGLLDPAALAVVGKPLLIDEADGWTAAYSEAIGLGYRGVSHKNCKGVIRSLLNQSLAWHRNGGSREGEHFLSAEDLTCLPVVSLQADLAVVAALGIGHVERNGHHYFHGLDHLPAGEADAALAAHPGLYRRDGGSVFLAIEDGGLDVSSLQVPGLGFTPLPDLATRTAPADWSFDSLTRHVPADAARRSEP
ncbi:mandelate racemase [Acuticoccus sediminis]|uniref:Mandelate racemase n=1 Tax=Acuticoccus sediminis TaxID=2184697 RepID=A0A8B2P1L6_9HYPH|nr:mandelate racemase [Acuticoccus sediminis]RAI02167.1 mandelate racemase [Acuticoccus sediminis]